jgi:non-specific serine/threonine protein kinase/serine/threonine-protein kinase
MNNDRHARILELLIKAVDLSENERRAYLSEACKDAPELQNEVESILADEEKSMMIFNILNRGPGTPYRDVNELLVDLRSFIKRSEEPAEKREPLDREELKGIDDYKLLEPLGEGGMGIVYLADQVKPVRRRVALKIIKLGMDTKQVVARFEAERQALAVMNHPNIARVYDAGATETGRPYFVMELVRGMPITDYCDHHKLTTNDRLDLFIPVCQAVQHAHQKGVIHRDLKPSNVLVTVGDEGPVPKIIDFGIAKAIEHRLTERTLFTEQGQLVGTPEYMSPEQAERTGLDVDTRTDIYSLGVMIYELLVGVLPFDPKTLRKAGYSEIQRIIREVDPPRISTRFSGLGDTQISVAEHRRTNPATLHKQLEGDLDWITMKSMSKDRTDRYASASELVADIVRYINQEPIQASPPSTLYRLDKFIKRHKTGVVAAALVILTLLIGIAGTSIGLIRAKRAENTAKQAERIAREEAATASEMSDFLVGLFKVSDPSETRGNSVTAREILDSGAEKIRTTLEDQPEVRSRLMGTMGEVYQSLGLYGEAELLLKEAVDVQSRVLGRDHLETLTSMNNLARLYLFQGKHSDAEILCLETLEIKRRVLGEDHPETLNSMNILAILYMEQGRYGEAEPLCLETLEIRRRVLGEDHPKTLGSMNNLAILYRKQGRDADAEPLYVESLEAKRRVLGDDHPKTLNSLNNLAILYWGLGRYADAEPLCLEALDAYGRVLGENHPETLNSLNNLAILYTDMKRYAVAESLHLETLEKKRRVLGEDHPETLKSMNNLALLYKDQKRYGEAERLYLDALHAKRHVHGDDHPSTLSTQNDLAVLYRKQGRYKEAEPILRQAWEARRRVLGEDHPETLSSCVNLACILTARERREESLAMLQTALEHGFAKDWVFDDPDLHSLRGDPEFEAFIAEVKKRLGEQ